MLLVTTALGIIGRELVRLLAAQGKPVRALVPRAKGELELKNYLAEEDVSSETLEVVVGGLHDPASIEAALQGVDGAALIVPASPDMVGLQSLSLIHI